MKLLSFLFAMILSGHSVALGAPESLKLILDRCRESLLERKPQDEATLRSYRDQLDEKGQWPDIAYSPESEASTKKLIHDHLERTKHLARSFATSGEPLFQDKKTGETMLRSLDWWLKANPQSGNWWHNEIGTPRQVRDLLILLPEIDPPRRAAMLEILHQFRVHGTGANLVWSADLALHYGSFTGDEALVAEMSKTIAGEIQVGQAEGIQSDYSFHQHGPRLQQFHYGSAFLHDTSRLAWQLHGTPWALPADKIGILSAYILEGSQWMARGLFIPPGTIDRMASRKNSLASGNLRRPVQYLLASDPNPTTRERLSELQDRMDGKIPLITGFRHFPKSDFTACHRPRFSFFLKTISSRTRETESINRENLKGKLLNCGDAYLIADGNEYHNLQPVWDWTLLPGVTSAANAGAITRRPIVGGTGNGQSGVAIMDSAFGGEEIKLSCRKLWAAHGDIVVCLISGLAAKAEVGPVRTALDQSRLRGPVTVGFADSTSRQAPSGEISLQNVSWIQHGTFAYILLQPSTITLKTRPVTGSWWEINRDSSPDKVEESIFLPILEHGDSPAKQAVGYVLAYCTTPEEAQKLATNHPWKITRNDEGAQGVEFIDGTAMAAIRNELLFRDASGKITKSPIEN